MIYKKYCNLQLKAQSLVNGAVIKEISLSNFTLPKEKFSK